MRRVFVFLAGAALGCMSANNYCEGEGPCPPPPLDTCEGGCVPNLGAPWGPVLVARTDRQRLTCPADAPWETMSSDAPPMTACGVQEASGECSAEGYACLPEEPGWTACVVRAGAHPCLWPYDELVDQPDETTTLCCPSEEPPG